MILWVLTDELLWVTYGLLTLYVIALTIVTIYCLFQFDLLFQYVTRGRRLRTDQHIRRQHTKPQAWPRVTIQLPIYNERYVIERLIQAICELDYPKDKMEIQVLDDSTDETVEICAKAVERQRAKGFNIQQIRRSDRQGYKAGALRDAMPLATGEYIAIFDADFLPKKDFLQKTLPYFQDERVGVVQCRWAHLNQSYSLLTEVQAFQLNVHFTIEQFGRAAGGLCLQFNGTAGVWRSTCIDDAGGWEADTLTEDLDLSYRAQLKGWEIVFLEDVLAPAELPAEMKGLKSQQYRWMKGGAETARKMLPTIWRSALPMRQKVHATIHLLSSSVFLAILAIGVLSVPLSILMPKAQINTQGLEIFFLGLLSIFIIYYVANVHVAWRGDHWASKILKFMVMFPLFLALSMGLALHNAVAVWQGYRGQKTAFVRTPKFNIKQEGDHFIKKQYFHSSIDKITITEALLCVCFLLAAIEGVMTGHYAFLPLHLALTVGYGMIFFYSIRYRFVR